MGKNFYAKIPMTQEGLRAVPLCKAAGISCTVTAIFTPMQALMAGMTGADYVAPYVDRLDNITSHGVTVVQEIVELFKLYDLKTQVLAASFKNVGQVYDVAAIGAHAVTVNGELCKKLLFHPYTDKSLVDFKADWQEKFGDREITELF
jgi:fructose-6-phosphate aldolase 2